VTLVRPPAADAPRRPGAPAPGPDRRRGDLLRHRPVAAAARSRWYPGVLRAPVAAGFGLVAYELLRGPYRAGANAGSALMWLVWWPALPVMFLVAGRFWCAVCPFGTLSDLVHRAVGTEGGVPRCLRSYGVWLIDVEFLAITWADHVWGIVDSPWGSAVLLMILTTAVVAAGAFLPRRSFCRYLCFLGGLCSTYSRAGVVRLGADARVCATCTSRAACYHGTGTVPGCPLFSSPRTLDTAAHCTLCARCVRSCPHDAITVRVRAPLSELWSVRRPRLEEAVLAMAIMGVVLIQNIGDLPGWRPWLARAAIATGCPVVVVFTVVFLATVCLPVGALAVASALAARGDRVRAVFTRFGYALIPLDVAAFVAHTQRDVLREGRRGYVTLARLAGADPASGPSMLAGPGTVRVVQWALVAAGTAGSVHVIRRLVARHRPVAHRRAALASFGGLAVLLGALNAVLFAVPATG